MNLSKLAPYLALALPLITACDPGSQSLGDEPTETASGSGSGGDTGDLPSSAETEMTGRLVGGSIQHIGVRDDGTVIAGGISGFLGVFGDLAEYENNWIGAYDLDGTLLWEQVLPKPTGEFDERQELGLTDVAVGPDGSVFATIIDYSASDNQILKYAADGDELWTTTLPARPNTVAPTYEGGAIVAGYISPDQADITFGWAARIDSAGAIVGTRTWENPDARVSTFEASTTTDDGVILGGRWGVSPVSTESEAWMVRIDDDLQTLSDTRLPGSGATDSLHILRLDDNGNILAGLRSDGDAVLTLDLSGDVLSSEPVDPDVVMWSPHSGTGFLGGDRNNCFEQIGGGDCGQAAFSGFDGSERLWDVSIEGCNAVTGHAVDAFESVVSVYCSNVVNGDVVVEAQLHRIIAE